MFRRSAVVDRLREVPLFSACSKSDLGIVARHLVQVEVPEGTAICREGEDGDAFYVVLRGEADVSRRSGTRSRRVAKLGPGSWFGELAVLDPAPRNATVSAAAPLAIGVLDARVFRAILRDVPAMSERLLAGLARRVREGDRRVTDDAGGARRPTSTPKRAAAASTPKRAGVAAPRKRASAARSEAADA